MSEHEGHIELERSIDSIVIGVRHRGDLGDIDALMTSIKRVGLLQPVTVTPEGVLVCGRRRLEAVKRLGWRTLKVWVRSGISDELSRLLAQQDENELRKPLDPLEQAALFREIRKVMAEDAARRQEETRFGAGQDAAGHSGEMIGAAAAAAPHRGLGDSRRQASVAVTGKASYTFLDQISTIERIAADRSQPSAVRHLAETELADIQRGADVKPAYLRVMAAKEMIDPDNRPVPEGAFDSDALDALAAEAMDRVRRRRARAGGRTGRKHRGEGPARRTLRAFTLTWGDLDGWSHQYDATDVGMQLSDQDWAMFERVLAETQAFAESARSARESTRQQATA